MKDLHLGHVMWGMGLGMCLYRFGQPNSHVMLLAALLIIGGFAAMVLDYWARD